MHRKLLIDLLEQYVPSNEHENLCKKDMVSFIAQHEDCFERTCMVGHITGSAWLLSKDHSKALLMAHVKLGTWLQLGGHCDGNPDVRAVAIKEAQEESGIQSIEVLSPAIFDIDIHRIPARAEVDEHYHYDVRFLLHVTSDEEVVQNSESQGLRWIGKNAAELPTDELSVKHMFDKWIALQL